MPTLRSPIIMRASVALVFAFPMSMLTRAETAGEPDLLVRGAEIFSREWVPGDPRSRGGDGLGPVYNDTSCVSCHGMGAPGGAGPVNKNAVLLTVTTATPQRGEVNKSNARLGRIHLGLLKARSIVLHRAGVDPDYSGWLRALTLNADRTSDERLRGNRASGRDVEEPPASIADRADEFVRESPTRARTFSVTRMKETTPLSISERNTPPLFGAGLIDAVPVQVLKKVAADQPDSIRGRVHELSGGRVGRFGWKAQTESLREFVLVACAGELGLEVPGHHQGVSPLPPVEAAPGLDLSREDCDALIAYVRVLPAPTELRPSGSGAEEVADEGRELFKAIGCAGCHTPNLGALTGVYSDLLLHDMGQSLNDSGQYYGESSPGDAQPSEWRTPPLWGFRDSAPYLHDGRAKTLDEAVAHHEGQARKASRHYFALSTRSRLRVQAFLKTLVAPPADPMSAVLYASDDEARAARLRRAETEQQVLDAGLVEASRSAAETLAEARRLLEHDRAELNAAKLQATRQRAAAGRRAVEVLMGRAETMFRAGEALERAGKIAGALTFYRESVALVPDSEPGRAAAARVAALAR